MDKEICDGERKERRRETRTIYSGQYRPVIRSEQVLGLPPGSSRRKFQIFD